LTRAGPASLRECLASQPAGVRSLIAYLTLGDPVDDFVTCAQSILDSGAVTLELGVPLESPDEGAVLLASHTRARRGGTDEAKALGLLSRVHDANPDTPLIAINHWSALATSAALASFVAAAALAGASAVLIVGLPFGQLAAFRRACDDAGVECVLSCFPDTPRRMRTLIYRQATGCIYIARGRGVSGGADTVDVADLCRTMRAETDVPLIVGFGIDTPQAVATVCEAGARAAVVGSALVDRVSTDPQSAAAFAAELLAGPA
jgi:tryptophan synthase alpha chain